MNKLERKLLRKLFIFALLKFVTYAGIRMIMKEIERGEAK